MILCLSPYFSVSVVLRFGVRRLMLQSVLPYDLVSVALWSGDHDLMI